MKPKIAPEEPNALCCSVKEIIGSRVWQPLRDLDREIC